MERFDIMPILKLAVKNIFILLLSGIVLGAAVFGYCKCIATPKYSATGSVLVTNGAIMTNTSNNANATLNNTDIVASMNLVNTVGDILNTNGIYKELAKELDNEYTYEDLNKRASVRRKNESSLFIDVSFSASSEKEALKLVNEFLALAPAYINEYVPNSEVAVSNADVSKKVFPHTTSYTFMATAAGMAISFLILLLVHSTNTVIRNEDDFMERFDVVVIGSIPDFEKSKSDRYNAYKYKYKNKYYNNYHYTRGGY